MTTIVAASRKGGVGKTTLAVNLAASLASTERRGRVLVIDLDDQEQAAGLVGLRPRPGLRAVLEGRADLADLIEPTAWDRLDLVSGEEALATVSLDLQPWHEFTRALGAAVDRLEHAWVVIDTPPALDLRTASALLAADLVVVPVALSGGFLAASVGKTRHAVEGAAQSRGRALPWVLVPNAVQLHTNAHQAALEALAGAFPDNLAPVALRHSVRAQEAAAMGVPLVEFDRRHPLADDYRKLATAVRRKVR